MASPTGSIGVKFEIGEFLCKSVLELHSCFFRKKKTVEHNTAFNQNNFTCNHKWLFDIFVMLLLHVSASGGHPNGGHLQRNIFITNTVKDMRVWI